MGFAANVLNKINLLLKLILKLQIYFGEIILNNRMRNAVQISNSLLKSQWTNYKQIIKFVKQNIIKHTLITQLKGQGHKKIVAINFTDTLKIWLEFVMDIAKKVASFCSVHKSSSKIYLPLINLSCKNVFSKVMTGNGSIINLNISYIF